MDSRQHDKQPSSGNNNYVSPGKQTLPDNHLTPSQFITALRCAITQQQYTACVKLLYDMNTYGKNDPQYQTALATFLAEKDAEKVSYFYHISQSAPVHIISAIIALLDDKAMRQLCLQYHPQRKLPIHALYENSYLNSDSANVSCRESIFAAYEHATITTSSMPLDENPDYQALIKRYPAKSYSDEFIQKIQVAWLALVSARRAIRHSTTQPHFNFENVETKNENYARLTTQRDIVRALNTEMTSLQLNSNIYLKLHHQCTLYKKYASGNCHEYALLVANELLKRGVTDTMAIVDLVRGDHTLTAFNFKQSPSNDAPIDWHDVIFVDAWSGDIFTYNEHLQYLKDCIFYSDNQYQNHVISVPYDQSIHELKISASIDPKTYRTLQPNGMMTTTNQASAILEARHKSLMLKTLTTHSLFAKEYIRTQHEPKLLDVDQTIEITFADDHYNISITNDHTSQQEVMTIYDLIYASLHKQYATLLESNKLLMIHFINTHTSKFNLFSHDFVVDDIVLDRLGFKLKLTPKPSALKYQKPYDMIFDYDHFNKYLKQALDDMYYRLVDKAYYYLMLHPEVYGTVSSCTFNDNCMQITIESGSCITLSCDDVLDFATQGDLENQRDFCMYFFDYYITAARNYFKYKKGIIPKIERDETDIWIHFPDVFPEALTMAELKRYAIQGDVLTNDAILACYDEEKSILNLHHKSLNDFDITTLVNVLQINPDITAVDLSFTDITEDHLLKLLEVETLTTISLIGVSLTEKCKTLVQWAQEKLDINIITLPLNNTATNHFSLFSPTAVTTHVTADTSPDTSLDTTTLKPQQ